MPSGEEFAILQLTLSSLRFHCIWPKKGKAFDRSRRHSVMFLLVMFSYLFFAIGTVPHFTVNIKRNNVELLTEDISVLSSMVGATYIVVLFFLKQNQLAHLFKDLSNLKKFGKPDNFDKINRKLNLFSFLFSSYCVTGIGIFAFVSYLQIPKCEQMKKRLNIEEVCGLFIPAWFPFEIDYFPVKQLVFLIQIYGAGMLIKSSATVSFLAFETSQHITIRLKHLQRLILEVFDVDGHVERRRRLNFCISYHLEIIRNYCEFDAAFSGPMGVHITITGIIFGCISNQLVQGLDLGALIHLVGWIVALYMVCVGGQSLLSESSALATSAYLSNWSNVEIDLQRDLQLVMLRSQMPFRWHALFEVLSLQLFITILKTSYSYMTMLNQSTTHME